MKIELDDVLADKLRMMHRWMARVKFMHPSDEPTAAFYGNVLAQVISQYDAAFKLQQAAIPRRADALQAGIRHCAACPSATACQLNGCLEEL